MPHQLSPNHFKTEIWITSAYALQHFKVSRSTLYRWRKSKQLPFTKLGGVIYFPKTYIQQLMGHNLQNKHFTETMVEIEDEAITTSLRTQ
jgi:predicted DNA-binding transcriptional regulator AlpA